MHIDVSISLELHLFAIIGDCLQRTRTKITPCYSLISTVKQNDIIVDHSPKKWINAWSKSVTCCCSSSRETFKIETSGLKWVASPDLLCNNEWKEGDDSVGNGNKLSQDHQGRRGQKPAKKQARSHSKLRQLSGISPRNAKVRPEDVKSNPVDVGEGVASHCTNATKNSEKSTNNTKRNCGSEYD